MDNLLTAAEIAIAFGFPALVASKRPDLYFRITAAFWTLGALAFTLVFAAYSFYEDGYRAALDRLNAGLQPEPLWGIDLPSLTSHFIGFCFYVVGIWVYGLFATVRPSTSSKE